MTTRLVVFDLWQEAHTIYPNIGYQLLHTAKLHTLYNGVESSNLFFLVSLIGILKVAIYYIDYKDSSLWNTTSNKTQ